ncbi:hypothetical protein DOY81_013962, partial [Sarcophaga bullata]
VNAQGTIIQGSLMQSGSVPTTVQVVQGQKVAVATSNVAVTTPSAAGVVTTVATSQVHQQQAQQTRAQFIKQVAAATGKQTIARQVGESDMLFVKRQMISTQQKAAQVLQQGGQIFTTNTSQGLQLQQTSASSAQTNTSVQQGGNQQVVQQVTPQQIATLVKTSVASSVGGNQNANQTISVNTGQQQAQNTVNMALSQLKPGGQIKVTMANQSQMRQLHMQQQQLTMPRKISRMTQIQAAQAANQQQQQQQQQSTTITQSSNSQQQQGVQVTQKTSSSGTSGSSNTGGVQTQLVHIQNTKSLPSSVTVQQIQQVMRQTQPGTLATTGFVLGKTSVGRVIPVSVASQSNQRQTIQVVSAASAQALAAGNLRAHVTGGQNIAGTIKVATSGSQIPNTTSNYYGNTTAKPLPSKANDKMQPCAFANKRLVEIWWLWCSSNIYNSNTTAGVVVLFECGGVTLQM